MSRKLPERVPVAGDLVQVRSRRWLVEEVVGPPAPGESPVVRLACADDDAQGQSLAVFWDYELDRRILEDEGWADLASKGFDSPRRFAAFLHTLRWHCVTATDPNLFQAPFRAGIRLDAYQMEPLRKALRLPRVNLFIADDTGLGKTIEAGLIARELLLRRKANTIVVAAPPSVLEQWKGELEDRFGLVFEILDRAYLSRMRRERGFGVNPWRTHSRFLVSHNLLIDPGYADPLREWLGPMLPGSLLILDEAHHAAPASGGRYGIETKFTRAIRDLAGRFEHRLFLSATPHNGHSNSFSTLLELLDPYRFTRGVKVRGRGVLDDVMVRRLKEDIREVRGGFPKRNVESLVIDDLPLDAPELALSSLLDEYRTTRERRHENAPRKARAAAGLLVVGLQQRLLSSIEAFARSLVVHRQTVERHWTKAHGKGGPEPEGSSELDEREATLFLTPPDADDERGEWTSEESEAEEGRQTRGPQCRCRGRLRARHRGGPVGLGSRSFSIGCRPSRRRFRHLPDAKTHRLIDWIRENQCPGLPPFGRSPAGDPPPWNLRRVLIFTENREGTKRYLKNILEQAIEDTDRARRAHRGHRRPDERKPAQGSAAPFQRRPGQGSPAHPDCDGRGPRGPELPGPLRRPLSFRSTLEPGTHRAAERPHRPASSSLWRRSTATTSSSHSARKTVCWRCSSARPRPSGGSSAASPRSSTTTSNRGSSPGFAITRRSRLSIEIAELDLDDDRKGTTREELEITRERQRELLTQIERCQSLLDRSRDWTRYAAAPFREALSCSLELLGAPPLTESKDEDGRTVWTLPRARPAGGDRTRAGPRPWTRSACLERRTRSSWSGAATHRSGR